MSTNESDKSAALSSYERSLVTKLADNPMELFAGRTVGWLEDFIRITVGIGPGNPSGGLVSGGRHVTGHYAWIAKDLTAFTTEYVYEDASGEYLYVNGALINQIQYADLYAYYGPNAFGTDTATHFYLPDARGRAVYCCGTHTNATLGDSDGIAVTSRQVNHQHAVSVTISGSAANQSAGTPSGSISASFTGSAMGTHTHTDSGHAHDFGDIQGVSPTGGSGFTGFTSGDRADVVIGDTVAASANISSNSAGTPAGSVSASFTGSALASHGHSVSGTGSGTAGAGMSADGPAHIFLGSLVVRF